MPRLSVYFIRAALVYLGLGFTFGALMLFNKGLPVMPWTWQLLSAHIEFLLIGWTVQLVMGVAFWILPRFSRNPKRGNVTLAWLAFVLLNIGVWLVAIQPVWLSAVRWISLLGRTAEAASALAFAAHAWPRIKPPGG